MFKYDIREPLQNTSQNSKDHPVIVKIFGKDWDLAHIFLLHRRFYYFNRRSWTVVPVLLNLCDSIDNVHTRDDPAEHGMPVVEEIVIYQIDEELASAGIRARICHRYGTAVIPVFSRKFITYSVPGPPAPGSRGIAALDHEAIDYAMEDDTVIISLHNQFFKIPGGDRHFWIELYRYRTHGCLEDSHFWAFRIGHNYMVLVKGALIFQYNRKNQINSHWNRNPAGFLLQTACLIPFHPEKVLYPSSYIGLAFMEDGSNRLRRRSGT